MVVIVIVLNISAAVRLSLDVYKLLDTLHFVQYGAIIESLAFDALMSQNKTKTF